MYRTCDNGLISPNHNSAIFHPLLSKDEKLCAVYISFFLNELSRRYENEETLFLESTWENVFLVIRPLRIAMDVQSTVVYI